MALVTRDHAVEAVRRAPSQDVHGICDKLGYDLYDVVCKCGNEIKRYIVHKGASVSDDLRYYVCLKCGAVGQWANQVTPKPKSSEERVMEIDVQMKELMAERELLSPSHQIETRRLNGNDFADNVQP